MPAISRVDPAVVAIWAIVLAPLAVIPGGFEQYALPKLVVVAVGVAVGSWAVSRGTLPREVTLIGLAGLAMLLLAAGLSEQPWAAFLGRFPRYEGAPVWLLYAATGWLGARVLPHPAAHEHLVRAFSAMTFLLAGFTLLDRLGISPVDSGTTARTGSLLGNATDQGIVGMLAVGVLVPAVSRRRPWSWAALAAALGVVSLSGSRAALVGTAAVLVIHALPDRRRATPLLASAAALIVLVLTLPGTRDRLLTSGTVEGRALLWLETLRLAGDHPLLGVGPSGFFESVRAYHDSTWVERVGIANPPDSPHSWPLQALATGGAPLALVAVIAAGILLATGWRAVRIDSSRLGLLAAVAGYLLVLLTHFTSSGTTPLAAFLAGGLVAVTPAGLEVAGHTRQVALAARAIGLTLAVALVLAVVGERPLRRGIDQAARGDVMSADASFRSAHRLRPWDPDLPMVAAVSLAGAASAGIPDAADPAASWARRALRRVPDGYDARVAWGVALLQRGDLDAALDQFDRAVGLAPTEPQGLIQRGITRFALRDVEGARDDLRRAQSLDPDDPIPGQVLDEIRRRVGG